MEEIRRGMELTYAELLVLTQALASGRGRPHQAVETLAKEWHVDLSELKPKLLTMLGILNPKPEGGR
jgi:hypothetical protein